MFKCKKEIKESALVTGSIKLEFVFKNEMISTIICSRKIKKIVATDCLESNVSNAKSVSVKVAVEWLSFVLLSNVN